MWYELDDHPEEYRSLTYEDWCDLMSTIYVKEKRKRAADHIKKIASTRAASIYDSNKPARVPRRKKEKTSVYNSHKSPSRAHARHQGAQSYCVFCKNAGMPERKHMLHITKY